ncbi:MAG: pyridoxamine 5'-phosphate oxidase family protein [Methanobacteriota archaeon]|nr:MAG: pyridoxamine 5'-phosphate oxidase family protein [Euryarchaeota archaeon]
MTIAVVKRRFLDKRIQRSVFRILRDSALCSMSTVAPGNRAHINTAYFCYSPDLNFYFLSDPDSLHCKNLERNPSMAMMVMNSSQTWGGSDRGIQLFGTCHRVRGPAAKEAERRYGSRFPGYATWLRRTDRSGRRGADLLRSYAFYRFVPTRIKILDEAEFGGAAFVIAGVTRRHPNGRTPAAIVTWLATEELRPQGHARGKAAAE